MSQRSTGGALSRFGKWKPLRNDRSNFLVLKQFEQRDQLLWSLSGTVMITVRRSGVPRLWLSAVMWRLNLDGLDVGREVKRPWGLKVIRNDA